MPRHWSEETAKRYLEQLGYRTLAQNYTIRGGELDLICQDGAVLVFVEVKQRRSERYGSAAEAIQPWKIQRLRRTALHYLLTAYSRDDLPLRFDAVLISGSKERHKLEHLKNIF